MFYASLTNLGGLLSLAFARGRVFTHVDGHDQILLRHQIIFCDEMRETVAQIRLGLEFVENATMVKVGVREDAIHPPTYGAQLGHRRLLDGHPGGDTLLIMWLVQPCR